MCKHTKVYLLLQSYTCNDQTHRYENSSTFNEIWSPIPFTRCFFPSVTIDHYLILLAYHFGSFRFNPFYLYLTNCYLIWLMNGYSDLIITWWLWVGTYMCNINMKCLFFITQKIHYNTQLFSRTTSSKNLLFFLWSSKPLYICSVCRSRLEILEETLVYPYAHLFGLFQEWTS